MENCLTEHCSASPEETEALGERFAQKLKPGSVVALKGGLGAGKTCFTRGIARALGITDNVTSPTYTIVNEYTRLNGQAMPLYHIDAYRLSGDEDFENTGADELLGQAAGQAAAAVVIIEWSERIPRSIPKDAITVEIEITGPESRLVRMPDIGDIR